MQTKTKFALILTVTLVIGMLLGVVISGFVVHNFMGHGVPQFREEKFLGIYHRLLGNRAFERPEIDSVLKAYMPRFSRTFLRQRQEMKLLFDSLNTDLGKYLTVEERERLDQHLERFKRRMGRMMRKGKFHDRNKMRGPRKAPPPPLPPREP